MNVPTQAALAAALRGAAVPAGLLRAWNGSNPERRFDVHRNNVIVSLTGALADTFPVLRELVGAEFFGAMAREFIAAHPPRTPVLTEWGDAMADWLARFPPLAALPYLPDLARLERARVRAYHAADADALDAASIAARLADPDPATLPQARWQLHPSLQVVESAYAIVSLWAAHQGEGEVGEVDWAVAEAACVLRRGDDVLVLRVDAAQARVIAALAEGQPLGAALACAGDASFDSAPAFALLIGQGAVVGWDRPDGA